MIALISVVVHMVRLERVGGRNNKRQVAKHSQEPIVQEALEGKVVGDLMNGEEQVRLKGSRKHVGCKDEPWPRQILAKICDGHFCQYHRDGNVFGQRFWAHQLGDLRVRLTDSLCTTFMWF